MILKSYRDEQMRLYRDDLLRKFSANRARAAFAATAHMTRQCQEREAELLRAWRHLPPHIAYPDMKYLDVSK